MADTKLTDLPAAGTLSGTEVLFGVQSGNNRKVSADQLKAFILSSPAITGHVQIASTTEPDAPADGFARLYVENDGTGRYRLMIMLPDGAPQQIAYQLGAVGAGIASKILLANGTDNLLLADGSSELLRM